MALTGASRPLRGVAAALLELDPELGALLDGERQASALRDLRVRVTTLGIGEWAGDGLAEADPAHYGLLIVDGVLAREVVLSGHVSTELLGTGDVVRPWRTESVTRLLPVEDRWNALTSVRIALLDRRVAAQLGAYPEVGAVLVDRLAERAQRLAVMRAIGQLNRVDERLIALFWHLAERWGHVASDGVTVPLALPHRLIGELIGARRPTVSTVLTELAAAGTIVRRGDGTWLLQGPAPGPAPEAIELVRQRRRLIPAPPSAPPAPLDELRAGLLAVQEQTAERTRDLEELRDDMLVLRARTAALLQRAEAPAAGRLVD